ncbi:MAG: type II toxin-antitoxin system VapC family toxin [Candidatus Korobacteraceae bacterium]
MEDEADRKYSLNVLASLSANRAKVPVLWFYEVGNGLVMAARRKRILLAQAEGFLARLKDLAIDAVQQMPAEILELPVLARKYSLTNYDAAYLELAMKLGLPLASTDKLLREAAVSAGVDLVMT